MSDANASNLTVRCRLCEREFAVASPYAVSKAKYCPDCRAVVDEERRRKAKSRHNAGRERDTATLRGVDHGERDINRLIAEAKTKPDCVSDARRGELTQAERLLAMRIWNEWHLREEW